MICRNCGALLGPDDSFCGSCGAPVLGAAPAGGADRSHGSSVPPAPPAPGFGATSTSTVSDPDDWDGTQASPAPPITASGAGYTHMGNVTESDGPTHLDPVSTQTASAATPQVVHAVPVPSSAPASASAQASGSSTSAVTGNGPSSRFFVALIIAIIVTVAVVVAGGAFVMYRLGQSSNVPTVQVAGSASSDKSTSTAQSSEDQQSSDSSDASDASKGSNGESGSGQSTGGQSSGTSSGNASSGTSSKAQNGTGNGAQSENTGNGSGSNGSDGQSTSSAASNIYVNARFRYHVTVPDGYTWNPEAPNGDGRTFDGPQGVRIAAWGQWNVLSHTPQGELDFLKENLDSGSSITFENVAGPSVYLSYYTPEGNIVYRKEIVTDKTLCGVEITYPPTARSIGDSLAETVPPTLGFLD